MASKPDPVDALLKSGPRRTRLPEPAERARLRTGYGLTQAEIAEALDVTRTTVAAGKPAVVSPRAQPGPHTRSFWTASRPNSPPWPKHRPPLTCRPARRTRRRTVP